MWNWNVNNSFYSPVNMLGIVKAFKKYIYCFNSKDIAYPFLSVGFYNIYNLCAFKHHKYNMHCRNTVSVDLANITFKDITLLHKTPT